MRGRVHGVNTHFRLVIGVALALYVLVLFGFILFENPGLGVGHFFYIPIALVALVTGPRIGAAAGVTAAALYAVATIVNPDMPTVEVLTVSTPIRLVTFVASGMLIGWFAQSNRELIERLEVLAKRDRLTGLPNMRAFESAVDQRLQSSAKFALLLGDMDGLRETNDDQGFGAGDVVLARLADTLVKLMRPDETLARVGGDEFTILAGCQSKEDAARRANDLERLLAAEGFNVTFGWAAFPDEGTSGLGLIRVADERLYARKLVRGRRTGEPQATRLGLSA
jgi:diguanylate cyclase (GGDEF)-like protein